jgi:Domain of unknown function (DUF4928)
MNIADAIDAWIASCVRSGKISRNTIAVGIVILDRLRQKVPLSETDILSKGGEISGSRAGLSKILAKYGIPEKFLKEVTTRQAHQDGQRLLGALNWGKELARISARTRDNLLKTEIGKLATHARDWLARKHIKIACDRQWAPSAWIEAILKEAKGKSGGKVEQHLVGAKLQARHPKIQIPNHPGHAGDAQTGRPCDFTIRSTCYHVTATPTLTEIKKCAANIRRGLHPVLLVPRLMVPKSFHLAEEIGIEKQLSVRAIEDFIGENIVEMANEAREEYLAIMKSVVETYNQRLAAVETDMSLRIELE